MNFILLASLVAVTMGCTLSTAETSSSTLAGNSVGASKSSSSRSELPGKAIEGSLRGKSLWFNPNASSVQRGIEYFNYPTAIWVVGDTGSVSPAVQAAGNELVTVVAYNIPNRDCGNYSAGGSADADSYRGWIESLANAIGDGSVIVILEPDALALDCAPNLAELLSSAVTRLKQNPNTYVYLDAGHSQYPELGAIIDRLQQANIEAADGFALNVSNFYSDDELKQRANQINAGLQSKIGKQAHYVIDTSRNGNGSNGEWCNPTGRALGREPSTSTDDPLLDAYLWVKVPGESDGTCNGGPPAGQWFERFADELASKPPKSSGEGSSTGSIVESEEDQKKGEDKEKEKDKDKEEDDKEEDDKEEDDKEEDDKDKDDD